MDEAPREEDGEDVDDAFRAVLEGLRTTLPGVQVLFAFLLILPLQESFAALAVSERVAFYFAFFGSAVASILLIAPSAHQRIRAQISGVKRRSAAHLHMTVRITIVGTIIFAVALVAAVFLVSSLVIDDTIGVVLATVAVAGLLGWSWFYVPLVTFSTQKR
jgi:hypothetical protein